MVAAELATADVTSTDVPALLRLNVGADAGADGRTEKSVSARYPDPDALPKGDPPLSEADAPA